jgi:hypothetical protein
MDALRFRQVANWVNLTTPLGLVIAKLGRADVRAAERRVVIATDYKLGFPVAAAFTVGSVIITRHDRDWVARRPQLIIHEERHAWQYVACLGLPFLPMYVAAMAWSQLRTGDRATRNIFERLAGLEDGGYLPHRDAPGSVRGWHA